MKITTIGPQRTVQNIKKAVFDPLKLDNVKTVNRSEIKHGNKLTQGYSLFYLTVEKTIP